MSSDIKQTLSEKVRRHTQFIYERASGISLSFWSEIATDFLSAADTIEALEGEVAKAKESAAKFNAGWGESIEISRKNYAAWKEAEARAERLRVALAFYAKQANWKPTSDDPEVPGSLQDPEAWQDEGSIARKALEDDKQ
jgi:hypothetical protein